MHRYRNLPQIVIQVIYLLNVGSFDIIVASTMLFSTISVFFSISQAMSRRLTNKQFATNARFHYRTKEIYKMKIECVQFKTWHRYTHTLLTNTICNVLGIDNMGNVQVFYVVPMRQGIMVYMEISNIDMYMDYESNKAKNTSNNTSNIFSKILEIGDNSNSTLNEQFKQELNEKLHFELGQQIIEPGQTVTNSDIKNFIGDNMKISIAKDKMGLSVPDQEDMVRVRGASAFTK